MTDLSKYHREADSQGDKKAFDFDRHHPIRSAGFKVSDGEWARIFGKRKPCYHPKYLRRGETCGRCGGKVSDGES